MFNEPLAADLLADSIFRSARYAWMQWRYRRVPDRSEFPDPPTPDWIFEYAERLVSQLVEELSALALKHAAPAPEEKE